MEIKTIFGVTWHVPSNFEIFLLAMFIVLIITFLVLLKLHLNKKDKRLNDYQLFLFKLKRAGLSNFQIKIINNISQLLKLKDPNILLRSPELYEKSIGEFLQFLRDKNEDLDSLTAICKDITITYDKIYRPASFKKPLKNISELELNQLLYFITPDGDIFLGKFILSIENDLQVKLFRNKKQLQHLSVDKDVVLHIWRLGDAEYIFNSKIIKIEDQKVILQISEEFDRKHEFRLPFLDIVQAALVSDLDENKYEGTVVKINDFELVLRSRHELDYQKLYDIHFELDGFKMVIRAQIIADSIIKENHVFYYTLKFNNMSEPARNVLKKYLYEHL